MQYRNFGKLDFKVSALGFGCMRLPTLGKYDAIDEPLAVEMIRYAIDHGVNYLDSAHGYHGGKSELVIAKALEGGYRDKVRIATKMPTWAIKAPADFDRIFEEQCEKLQTQRIDFYLLHNLQAGYWANVRDLGVLAWLDRMLADGRIGHTGFSFHDSFDLLKEVIGAYPNWTVCQVQYNYVCEDVQAGTAGVMFAADKGLAVVVMEPLFGGTLANPPPAVRALWDAAGKDPADVALRWLWDMPEVATVLSGMSTLEQVRRNVASAAASGVGTLSADEHELVARVREAYKELSAVPCTGCGYCVPCPTGVAIPENFQLLNHVRVLGGSVANLNRNLYRQMPKEKRADACVACGKCEERCPQHIQIADWLARVHLAMTEK
ncbi:MAG TPA: aldo/keto reductase [Planctomycetota bacterium]|nr:aldo/keto reductase [Planctomycetota bacterium]